LFLAAGAVGVAINARGAVLNSEADWYTLPVSIDEMPERIWSWRDPEFLRGILPASQPPSTSALGFYAIRPCRVFDTRLAAGTFGGPGLTGGQVRLIPIPDGSCGIPHSAGAYSLNFTAIPRGRLDWLNAWETGDPIPITSILNAPNGSITANAAIVRSGSGGSISVMAAADSDLVIDISGYFAPAR
jgi:hypothetical protein